MTVVVSQLVERSLLTTEFHGSNPVIDKVCRYWTFTFNCKEKTKIKEKEAGNGPFSKKEKTAKTQISIKILIVFPFLRKKEKKKKLKFLTRILTPSIVCQTDENKCLYLRLFIPTYLGRKNCSLFKKLVTFPTIYKKLDV